MRFPTAYADLAVDPPLVQTFPLYCARTVEFRWSSYARSRGSLYVLCELGFVLHPSCQKAQVEDEDHPEEGGELGILGEVGVIKLRTSEALTVSDIVARAALAARQAQKLSQAASKASSLPAVLPTAKVVHIVQYYHRFSCSQMSYVK